MTGSNESGFRYDDRVVVITGAGGGIGRAHALAFARQGAKVVVNDLGVSVDGEQDGASNNADRVVSEIEEIGGEATASYSSVESGQEIIEQALDTFGQIDVLINNAGITFPVAFEDMTFEQWRRIHRIHLDGSFTCSKAAWPHMKARQYGRIVMTASPAMYGAEYLAHYSTAKAAMPGLANSLALEGAAFNIHCNAIAPTALSRMVSSALPQQDMSVFSIDPMDVAQLAVWLCHEGTNESGSLFEVGGGFVAKFRYAHSKGVKFESGAFTAQDLADHKQEIDDFDVPFFPAGSAEMSKRVGLDLDGVAVFDE